MGDNSIFSVISPIMAGPSSSHTAGAVRLGLMARNIYDKPFSNVKFVLYNSFALTGFGHGTDKGLLAGVMGYSVDDNRIKNIFTTVSNIAYSYEYQQDISRHPNSVDIIFDEKFSISGDSIGAGEIRINKINGFSANINGSYDMLMLSYKDKPGMVSMVSNILQENNINIASMYCDRDAKGGTAVMYFALDIPLKQEFVEKIKLIDDVFYVSEVRKLK